MSAVHLDADAYLVDEVTVEGSDVHHPNVDEAIADIVESNVETAGITLHLIRNDEAAAKLGVLASAFLHQSLRRRSVTVSMRTWKRWQ